MKYLIDTHILIWSVTDDDEFSPTVKSILQDSNNEIFVSAVSLWEIAVKFSLGKLNIDGFEINKIEEYCKFLNFKLLPLNPIQSLNVMNLPQKENHKDPFDRMLISQAISNDFTFISRDGKIPQYVCDGLKLVW